MKTFVAGSVVCAVTLFTSGISTGAEIPRGRVAGPAVAARTAHKALPIHVAGHRFVNSRGQTVRLLGFNNSGAEYACIEGWGIFDLGDGANTDVPVSDVVAMTKWSGANAVRLQLNEQCWLGIGGVKPRYGGTNYRRAVAGYVRKLTNHGFAVILNLHLSAPGHEASRSQEAMPDHHSVRFWHSVAKRFRGNRAVLFDLFNEPWPDNQAHGAKAWHCWRNGGCRIHSQNGGETYRAVGMNRLVHVVRSAGARNVILAGGVNYASSLGKWLAYRPHDPQHNLAASIHIYSFNGCTTAACYNRTPAKVARRVPLYIGEFGPDLTVGYSPALDSSCPSRDVGHTGFDRGLIRWARTHGASWTAWTWNPWSDCWALIRGFAGHPTSPYGHLVRRALRRETQSARA
jgi:endoglucanase